MKIRWIKGYRLSQTPCFFEVPEHQWRFKSDVCGQGKLVSSRTLEPMCGEKNKIECNAAAPKNNAFTEQRYAADKKIIDCDFVAVGTSEVWVDVKIREAGYDSVE
ncbi:MAG: hypothetical protein VX137_04510 [Pseudomonadota bacterium]|nr:hypothetical protein [Pseudomonadota bacterium]